MNAARVVVVGLGYAGRRFVGAVSHLDRTEGTVTLVGGVDHEPSRALDGIAYHADVVAALDALQPDVVCVTVNEAGHAEVFSALAGRPSVLVLTEKPLAATWDEAVRAADDLARHRVSVNLVERFSPLVDRYLAWVANQGGVEAVRAEAFWGKHRLFDARPTIGVLSELIHPLDLVDHLFVPLGGHPLRATTVVSDFSVSGGAVMESVDVTVDAAGVPVTVHASFAWPTRMRTVTALVRTQADLHRVVLTFDDPHWDCDHLSVDHVDDTTGRWERRVDLHTDIADQPPEIAGVAKVVEFVRRSIAVDPMLGRTRELPPHCTAETVDLAAAMSLQRLLHRIDRAGANGVVGRYRHAGTP